MILASSVPLFYVCLTIARIFGVVNEPFPAAVALIDDATKIILGGLMGWIAASNSNRNG